ncbi:GerAB/ArcD/ProY family transporter [Paenibacillus kobensis]|uniref:GerAB/ArcD/ProY family transporter n=1 Tax=Paenibacillus kobensis TaxID=59841 RepID=UPI000FDB8410|nr:endospore germination permease [Paenibacillus kobensis]
MLANQKISALQMALLLYSTVLATGFMVLPSFAALHASNDYWMTGLLAGSTGVIAIGLAVSLHTHFPRQTVIEYGRRIVGKAAGTVIGLVYAMILMHLSGVILREYAEFVKGNFLFNTPGLFIMISMIGLSACAVRGGVEVIARGTMLFTPLFVIPLFILLMLIPDLNPGNMLPVLNHGFRPVLQGSIMPGAWVSEMFLMNFLLPSLANPEQGRRWGFISLTAIVLSMTYINFITLFLLNADAGDKMFPVLVAFRYISVGGFFENLESLLLAMWVIGSFVKLTVFLYSAVVAFHQSAGLSEHRYVAMPITLVVLLFAYWDMPSLSRLSGFLSKMVTFEVLVCMIVIPLFLYTVAKLRGQLKEDKGGLDG